MTNSYIQVPPDSTGKKLASREHLVDATTVQVELLHVASPTSPGNLLEVDSRGSASIRFAEGQPILSGYGSLKTTEEQALGVYEASMDSYDDLFTIISASGGASTYSAVSSSTILSTTTTSGSSVSRTTNRYHYYLPGSSNIARMSMACGDTGKLGNARRWGIYDDNDGIYFELYQTSFRLVIRSSTGGSVVNTPIPQSSWNQDKLDGTGVSGINLDVTKINNYWADYEWNGAGRIRIGIYEPSGARLVTHIIQNANAYGSPAVRAGTLPFRTENFNFSATSSGSELREICMSIHTEGNITNYTFWRNSDIEVYGVPTTTDTLLVSARSIPTINSKHNSVVAYPELLSVFVTGGSIKLTLFQTTLVTGGTWIPGASTLESNSTGTVNYTNAGSFLVLFLDAGSHNIDVTKYFELNDEGIMANSDGVCESWTFTATKLSGTTVTTGLNLGYRELW